MSVSKPVFSYTDLARTPEDGKRYEIVRGELLMSPAPTVEHHDIAKRLFRLLLRAEDAGYGRGFIAPVDVVFDPHNVTQPDLFFIRPARLSIVTRANVRGAPDLIVEILSPGTRDRDLGDKRRLYARFGAPYYWVVDPDTQTVQPYTLHEGDYAEEPPLHAGQPLSCPLFPGITIDVAATFA